jgi:hypothetical protein
MVFGEVMLTALLFGAKLAFARVRLRPILVALERGCQLKYSRVRTKHSRGIQSRFNAKGFAKIAGQEPQTADRQDISGDFAQISRFKLALTVNRRG